MARCVAQLKIVDFAPGTQLSPEGNIEFRCARPARQPIPATGQVRQGMLEASNSDPVTSAVALDRSAAQRGNDAARAFHL